MKVVHISLARVNEFTDPESLLRKIDFFTGQIECMAAEINVESVHLISHTGAIVKNNVKYHFIHTNVVQWLLPFGICSYVSKLNPSVVIIHGMLFPWQILWLTLKLDRNVRIYFQHHAERPLRFPKSVLQKLIDQRASGYFFTSKGLADSWVQSRQIKEETKIHELMEVSSRFSPLNRDSTPQSAQSYIWVGRLDLNKDPETLIRAFIRFSELKPDAILYLIYDGDAGLNGLKKIIANSGKVRDNIKFVGRVKHDQLLYWYNKCAFVISTSHYESGGTAVCEAMSCGCIPILSDIPSFRTMTLNGEIGFLFSPGRHEELFNALKESSSIDLNLEKLKVLKQFRENLSFEAISNKLIKLITANN